MLDVTEVDASKSGGLTHKIVSEIRCLVETRELRPGTRPALHTRIRLSPRSQHVHGDPGLRSAGGLRACHCATRGRVLCRETGPAAVTTRSACSWTRRGASLGLLRRQAYELPLKHLPGYGWLPDPWLEKSGIASAFRKVSRSGLRGFLGPYDNPRGLLALRAAVSRPSGRDRNRRIHGPGAPHERRHPGLRSRHSAPGSSWRRSAR